MKNKKRLAWLIPLIVIGVVVLLIFVFAVINRGMHYYYLDNRPSNQQNTTWVSEDGKISIHIDENYKGSIYIKQDDSVVEGYFVSGMGYFAHVYSLEALKNNRLGLYSEELYEVWNYDIVEKDTFTITVKKTTFLEEGKKITFKKTQEEINTRGRFSCVD